MQTGLQKGDLLYSQDGCQVFATDDAAMAVVEWEETDASRLSALLHTILRRHALSTNFVERQGERSLIVRRLEPIALTVVANSTRNDTIVKLLAPEGTVLDKDEAALIPGAKKSRLDMMQDTALHAARSLRAHLAPADVELKLTFGLGHEGACLLHVINPLVCQLGTTDYAALCAQLENHTR